MSAWFAGTVMRLLELLVFCFGNTKWLMYLGITSRGLAYLVSLTASSITSQHTAFDEQVREFADLRFSS